MPLKVIKIPGINDRSKDFIKLFELWNQLKAPFQKVRFDFSCCNFLRPNAVAFLGGLARFMESRQGVVTFDWETVHSAVKNNLCQNGFAGAFNHPISRWDGNSIPYREDKTINPNEIMDYLEHYWIGKGWVNVSKRLMNAIVGHMWEIYNNAFEHSGSEIGVFSCGQHFPKRDELMLSVIDFGVGIAGKVRNFLKDDPRASQLKASACLQWAFQRGTTTKTNEPGGNGLDLLKEFIQLNQGRLEVYSNEGYAIIDKNGERYENCGISFDGTLLHITLHCDEKLYQFKDETY